METAKAQKEESTTDLQEQAAKNGIQSMVKKSQNITVELIEKMKAKNGT